MQTRIMALNKQPIQTPELEKTSQSTFMILSSSSLAFSLKFRFILYRLFLMRLAFPYILILTVTDEGSKTKIPLREQSKQYFNNYTTHYNSAIIQ